MKLLLSLIFLLATSSDALACSIIFPPPEDQFSESQLVVLARPIAISYRPKEAANRGFDADFTQAVLWEVLLSWKGHLRSGDKFTTRRMFSRSEACSSYFPVHPRDAELVFTRGREPFSDFHFFGIESSPEFFKLLATKPTR